MLVSCKVSYSILVYAERQGHRLEAFFEKQDQPVEFLKDPSYWLPIEQLEAFIEEFTNFLQVEDSETFVREVGQKNCELKAWGVLDSVLKMVESANDVFSQPERFLSYFMSPPPAVKMLASENNEIQFALGIDEHPYPLVMSYLLGAVEGLPRYMAQPPAQIRLENNVVHLSWRNDQDSLLPDHEKMRRQFNPEMVKSVMDSLEQHQQQIEKHNRLSVTSAAHKFSADEIEKKVKEEVERRMAQLFAQKRVFAETLFSVKNDFYKVYDYFVRAQQLITLISGGASKATTKEAMRRVDWAYVQIEFPQVVERACDTLIRLKEACKEDAVVSDFRDREKRQSTNLNELMDEVIESLQLGTRQLKIDKHWLLDKEIALEPSNFAVAVRDILQASVAKSKSGDEVRIVTRPNGRKAEIEITDTGQGFDENTLRNIFAEDGEVSLSQSQKIIRGHDGNISISSRQGEGATFLIEIPL